MGQEILGIKQFVGEMGCDKYVRILSDSSAAKGILARKGCGTKEGHALSSNSGSGNH